MADLKHLHLRARPAWAVPSVSPLQWDKAPSRHTLSSLPCSGFSSSDSTCLLCPSAALSALGSGFACCGAMPRMPQGFKDACTSVWVLQAVFSPFSSSFTPRVYFQAPPLPLPWFLTLIIQPVNLLPAGVRVVSELISLQPWLWQGWNLCSWPILGVWNSSITWLGIQCEVWEIQVVNPCFELE